MKGFEVRHLEYRGDNKDLCRVTFEDVDNSRAYDVLVARNGHVVSATNSKCDPSGKRSGRTYRVRPETRMHDWLAKAAHHEAFAANWV